MPFNRVYDRENEEYYIDRTITSPPPPPETGEVVDATNTVVVRTQTAYPKVPPATPVNVTLPGPNEPLVLMDGRIAPRWWRFLDELYRRTGGIVDNINRAPETYVPTGTQDELAFTGYAPTIVVSEIESPSIASVAITGYAPTVV